MTTLLTITEADLNALKLQLSEVNAKLDRVLMAPKPEWITVKDYAALIHRSEETVRRKLPELQTQVMAGVVMIRNPEG